MISQNVTNKGFLICIKSEKCAFSVILGSIRQGEAKLRTLSYFARLVGASAGQAVETESTP